MGSQAEPWNEVVHKNCMKEKYENYNKVNSLTCSSTPYSSMISPQQCELIQLSVQRSQKLQLKLRLMH